MKHLVLLEAVLEAVKFLDRSRTQTKIKIDAMKITRQIAADKIADYLHGKLGQTELVLIARSAQSWTRILRKRTSRFCQTSLAVWVSRMSRNSFYDGKTAKSSFVDLATARE